jgi:signal transduction histidine kinase
MGQGVAVFSFKRNLLYFNNRYLDLMKVPGGLIRIGMSHDDIARLQAERGIVTERNGNAGSDVQGAGATTGDLVDRSILRFARGKVLFEDRTSLPDGGFVATYTEITGNELESNSDAGSGTSLKLVLDHVADGVRVFDSDMKLVAFNKVSQELTRFPKELFRLGTSFEEFAQYSERDGKFSVGLEIVAERVARARKPVKRASEITMPDGRVIRRTRTPLPGGGFVSTHTDVTELIKAQEEAVQNVELLGTILGKINHGIRVIDGDGKLVLCNERFQKLFDFPEELLGKGTPYEDMTRFSSQRSGRSEADVEARVQRRLKRNREKPRLNRIKKYSSGLVVHQNMEPMPDGGFVTTYTDVTQLEQVQVELLKAKEAAEGANHLKSAFLATVSHELRTPLNAIIGFSEIISREIKGPLGAPCYKDYALDILNSGNHLLSLINDLLDLSKVEAGKVEIHDEVLNVSEIIGECLAMTKRRAKENGVKVVCDCPDSLPLVRADARLLKQILLNLVSNAVKFTPLGGRMAVTASLDGYGRLEILVSDTGIGIASEDLLKVLEPFGQVENPLIRREEGTGLGLPLAKSLTELHGGELLLESSFGEGTIVTIRIPSERVVPAED